MVCSCYMGQKFRLNVLDRMTMKCMRGPVIPLPSTVWIGGIKSSAYMQKRYPGAIYMCQQFRHRVGQNGYRMHGLVASAQYV